MNLAKPPPTPQRRPEGGGPSQTSQLPLHPARDIQAWKEQQIDVGKLLRRCRAGAAPGFDQVAAPMLKQPALAGAVAAIIRNAAVTRRCPAKWQVAVIVPVLKGGTPAPDPHRHTSYRPIAVGSVLSKMYAYHIKGFIDDWLAPRPILLATQTAFRKHHSTMHNNFVLHHLVETAAHHGTRVYSAFIDLSKAFDSVDRLRLWKRLRQMGMPDLLVQAVEAMYKDTRYAFKLDGGHTEPFLIRVGVRQGCPLSPLLFSLFLDGLHHHLQAANETKLAGVALGKGTTRCLIKDLFYADDIVLTASTPAQLQQLLTETQTFCDTWGLTVNHSKSEVVVFRRRAIKGRLQRTFHMGGTPLQTSNTFKYLGVELHATKDARHTAEQRLPRFQRAWGAAIGTLLQHHVHKEPRAKLLMLNQVATPALLYGCEVWGWKFIDPCDSLANDMERARLQLVRAMFKLKSSTCAHSTLIELGLRPLQYQILKRMIKFYNGICNLSGDSLYRLCMHEHMERSINEGLDGWATALLKTLQLIQPPGPDDAPWELHLMSLTPIDHRSVMAAYMSRWLQLPLIRQASGSSRRAAGGEKAQSYLKLYTKYAAGGLPDYDDSEGLRPARYLDLIKSPKKLLNTMRFRLSNHRLMIEMGRWRNIPREHRTCQRCAGTADCEVDDEVHCLLACPTFSALRHKYTDLFSPDTLCSDWQIKWFNQRDLLPVTVNFIHDVMTLLQQEPAASASPA
jgi:hypothetical protein